jgi:hypothetical protein
MSGIWSNQRLRMGVLVACMAMGATQGTAFAGTHPVLPPDRVDRIGATVPDAPVQLPPDRVDRIGVTVPDAPVQLPPDRVDGLGTARLPTVLTPITVVRTVSAGGFDWLAAVSGAAVAMALVLVAGAARIVRAHRLIPSKL